MYFSNLHENVVFCTWYPGPYTLYGDVISAGAPVSCKRRVTVWPGDLDAGPGKLVPGEFKTLVLEKSVCAVKPGFIESFPHLKDLIVEADLKVIPVTPELEKLLKGNTVIVRGSFNSAVEKLAASLGLTFIHKNITVARYYEERHSESTTLTLSFQKGESPFIWEDVVCPGWAASNNGGGTLRHDLPADFYKGGSIEAFSKHFGSCYTKDILANEEIKAFLKEADHRGAKAWIRERSRNKQKSVSLRL